MRRNLAVLILALWMARPAAAETARFRGVGPIHLTAGQWLSVTDNRGRMLQQLGPAGQEFDSGPDGDRYQTTRAGEMTVGVYGHGVGTVQEIKVKVTEK